MSQPLIHSSARVLEFDALRDLLRGYASSPLGQSKITALAPSTDSTWITGQQDLTAESPLGQSKITALAPSTDSTWITGQQDLTAEVREFRRVGGRFDFSGLLDVTTLVKKS